MEMQSNEGTVMFSSIALLQERFRELERIKEKREKLLQMLARDERSSLATTTPRDAPPKWFFHPELLYPCKPLRDTTATLFPVVPPRCDCKTFQLHNNSLGMDLWPNKAYKNASGEEEVDTSLHL